MDFFITICCSLVIALMILAGSYAIMLLLIAVFCYDYICYNRSLNTLRSGQDYLNEIYMSDKMLDTVEYKQLEQYDMAYHNYREAICKDPRHCKDIGDFPRYYKGSDGKLIKEGHINIWNEPSYGILTKGIMHYILHPLF
ncbi:MAG: hypothetical protein IJ593_05810 [Lachnospiraceae bacterium]|nr:hypothetical protein [Lachnospiraceae bacterium]